MFITSATYIPSNVQYFGNVTHPPIPAPFLNIIMSTYKHSAYHYFVNENKKPTHISRHVKYPSIVCYSSSRNFRIKFNFLE